jgi:uncharacterized delta-60 repeat protein
MPSSPRAVPERRGGRRRTPPARFVEATPPRRPDRELVAARRAASSGGVPVKERLRRDVMTAMRSRCPLSPWLVFLLALAACGGSDGSDDDDVPPTPTVVATPVATATPVEVAAGALDTGFGTNGLVLVSLQRSVVVAARGLRVTPEGGTEVLIVDRSPSFLHPVVLRFGIEPDGSNVEADVVGGSIEAEAAAIDGEGRVWIAGRFDGVRSVTRVPPGSDGTDDFHAPLALATVSDLVPLPDGGVLAVGRTDALSALQRFAADGRVDTTFGRNGVVLDRDRGGADVSNVYARAAIAPDGRIFVGGTQFTAGLAFFPIVLAYEPSGTPDSAFGLGGLVVFDFIGNGGAVVAMPNGDVVTTTMNGPRRLTRTGGLDAEWAARAASLEQTPTAVGPGGDLVAAGSTFVPDEPRRLDCSTSSGGVCQRAAWVVSRLRPDGAPDARFGGAGTVVTDTPAPNGASGTGWGPAALAPAGRVTTAGLACRAPFVCDLAVARYVDVTN